MNTRLRSFAALLVVLVVPSVSAASREWVLLPISGPPVRGAHGSTWVVEHALHNDGDATAWMGRSDCMLGYCGDPYEPGHSYRIRPTATNAGYLVLGVQAGDASRIHVTTIVRDTSRLVEPWGTTIPSARPADFRDRLQLIDIPVDEGFRLTLRVYRRPDDPAGSYAFVVRVFAMAENETRTLLQPDRLLFEQVYPASFYLLLNSLETMVPADAGRLRIEVTETSGKPVWGFGSATNSDTQHVTIFAPR